MKMKHWDRVGDDQVAHFGTHSFLFRSPVGTYVISVNEEQQDFIEVRQGDEVEYWPIERKEHCGLKFKLSGVAWPMSQIDLADYYWFELSMEPNAEIKYWGDQVLHRVDTISKATGIDC